MELTILGDFICFVQETFVFKKSFWVTKCNQGGYLSEGAIQKLREA